MDYRLIHGDCLEVLPTLEAGSVDLVLADPPYGTTACKWDSVIPFEPMWAGIKHVIKRNAAVVLFGSQPFTSALVMSNPKWFKYEWIWDKVLSSEWHSGKHRPLLRHEHILIFSQGTCSNGGKLPMPYYPIMVPRDKPREGVFGQGAERYKNPKGISRKPVAKVLTMRYPTSLLVASNAQKTGLSHATQKPVALMDYLVRTYTNEGETVLDFTCGSATTGVACLNTGRRFIGVELDEGYFDIAARRLEAAAAQKRLAV